MSYPQLCEASELRSANLHSPAASAVTAKCNKNGFNNSSSRSHVNLGSSWKKEISDLLWYSNPLIVKSAFPPSPGISETCVRPQNASEFERSSFPKPLYTPHIEKAVESTKENLRRVLAESGTHKQPLMEVGNNTVGSNDHAARRMGFEHKPKLYHCYLCGKEFGTASLVIHVRQCYKKITSHNSVNSCNGYTKATPSPSQGLKHRPKFNSSTNVRSKNARSATNSSTSTISNKQAPLSMPSPCPGVHQSLLDPSALTSREIFEHCSSERSPDMSGLCVPIPSPVELRESNSSSGSTGRYGTCEVGVNQFPAKLAPSNQAPSPPAPAVLVAPHLLTCLISQEVTTESGSEDSTAVVYTMKSKSPAWVCPPPSLVSTLPTQPSSRLERASPCTVSPPPTVGASVRTPSCSPTEVIITNPASGRSPVYRPRGPLPTSSSSGVGVGVEYFSALSTTISTEFDGVYSESVWM